MYTGKLWNNLFINPCQTQITPYIMASMITFYKHSSKDCLECYETETTLKNLVVAHTIKPLDSKLQNQPSISEGNKEYRGHKAIKKFIKDLEQMMDLWQKFQGDSCYTDTDGKIC